MKLKFVVVLLNLDEIITRIYSLDKINQVTEDTDKKTISDHFIEYVIVQSSKLRMYLFFIYLFR